MGHRTIKQGVQLQSDLTLVEEGLQDIGVLMRVCYGEDSPASNSGRRGCWRFAAFQVGIGEMETAAAAGGSS
jgi:hypothetical protein